MMGLGSVSFYPQSSYLSTDWYLERQEVFERFFADQVSRFKAAHMVENFEDLVYRTTKDVTTLLELFGSLERWPLCNRRLSYIKVGRGQASPSCLLTLQYSDPI